MPTAYDEFPYTNLPFAQTRPAVLATVAALHGLTPRDPRQARVLELGCGGGANLAGIAAADPGVRAVGVDLAPTAVEVARAIAAAAGLDNARFDVGDVLALTGGELGEFDYVIVHGLYAWADAPVREAVLAACRSHLAPDGIAYLSYTAHPGGHLRQMLREMAPVARARDRGRRARAPTRARGLFALLDSSASPAGPSFYEGLVGGELHMLATAPDATLVHDLLDPSYAPVWFRDFAAAAARHGMAYVGDSSPESSREPAWSPAVAAFVDEAAGDDRDRARAVLRRARPAPLPQLAALPRRPRARAARGPDRGPAAAGGRGRRRRRRCARAAARRARRGRARPVRDAARAARRTGRRAGRDARAGLRRRRRRVPRRPVAGGGERRPAPARERAGAQPGAPGGALVTTLHNGVVRITDEPTGALLSLLDGTRDRAAILEAFPGALSAEALDEALAKFAEMGLLFE